MIPQRTPGNSSVLHKPDEAQFGCRLWPSPAFASRQGHSEHSSHDVYKRKPTAHIAGESRTPPAQPAVRDGVCVPVRSSEPQHFHLQVGVRIPPSQGSPGTIQKMSSR